MNFKYILLAALLAVIFAPNSEMVQAAGDSISISSVELVLSNDVDGNGWANDNDIIQVTAIVNNTDGSDAVAGTEISVDVSPYQGSRGSGGVFITDLPLVEDNSGVGDVYQDTFEIISTDGSESGIEVGVNDAASRVQVIATDSDEVVDTTMYSNPLGDGSVDTRVVNGVDTIYPTDQDTVFASSLTRYPDQTFEIVLPIGDTTWHLAPAGLTTTAQIFAQAEVSQGGSDETTQVPDVLGQYRLYLVDDADQPSPQSSAVLTVVNRSGGGGSALSAFKTESKDGDSNKYEDWESEEAAIAAEEDELAKEYNAMTREQKIQYWIDKMLEILRDPNVTYEQKTSSVGFIGFLISMQGL